MAHEDSGDELEATVSAPEEEADRLIQQLDEKIAVNEVPPSEEEKGGHARTTLSSKTASLLRKSQRAVQRPQRKPEDVNTQRQAVKKLQEGAERARSKREEASETLRRQESDAVERAREERKRAQSRLRQKSEHLSDHLKELRELQRRNNEEEEMSIEQMRAKVLSIRRRIAEGNDARENKCKEWEEHRQKEYSRLLEEGKNPYEEFRRREEEEDRRRRQEEREKRQKKRANATIASLLHEEEAERRRHKEHLRHEELVAQRERERSRVKEKELDEFMRNKTVEGVTLVDPTGKRQPLHPSQMTRPKTWAFGTGRSESTVVKRIQEKHNESPSRLLVGSYADEEGAAESRPDLPKPKLSKYEKDLMEKAKQRQRQNIVQKQVVCGKEFQGGGFLPNPKTVQFSDVEPGESYERRLILTNRSLSFNSFRVLDFPEHVQHLFSVQYDLPGKVAAGVAVTLRITFYPDEPQDLQTCLPVLTQTGRMEIPIVCSVRKVVPNLSTERLAFGKVVVGESQTQHFTVSNDGGLGTEVEIVRETNSPSFTFSHESVSLKPYSKKAIKVTFSPEEDQGYEEGVKLRFKNDGKELRSALTGRGVPLPVILERGDVDFQVCFVGKTYRAQLRVLNRASVVNKCSLWIPHHARRCLSSHSDLVYCQANEAVPFELIFSPDDQLMEDMGEHVSFDCRIVSAGQSMPLWFKVEGRLTSGQLTFEPDHLDFGQVPLGEAKPMEVTIQNHAAVAQRYAFVDLPKGVTMDSSTITGRLLPNGSRKVPIFINPRREGEQAMKLTCMTADSTRFKLPVRLEAVQTPVALVQNAVMFAGTALGDTSSCCVVMKNGTGSDQVFRFESLGHAGITVDPSAGVVKANATKTVLVEFDPQEWLKHEKEQEGSNEDENEPVRSVKESGMTESKTPRRWRSSTVTETHEENNWVKRQCVSIACFVDGYDGPPIHLEVTAAAKEPKLVIESIGGKSPEKARGKARIPTLDFGKVPASGSSEETVVVRNKSDSQLTPCAEPLDHDARFFLSHALNPIPPGGKLCARVCFSPKESAKYYDTLTLRVPGERTTIELKGRGISPEFTVDPRELDMGDILLGNFKTRQVSIENTSSFAVSFSLAIMNQGRKRSDGSVPFHCSTSKLTLDPSSSDTVSVTFRPDSAHPAYGLNAPFRAELRVIVKGHQSDAVVSLCGRGWSQPAYVRGGTEPEGGIPHDPREPWMPVVLPGSVGPGETCTAKVAVGAARREGKSSGIDFEMETFSEPAKALGWSMDPAKGSAAPGEEKEVALTLTIPSDPPLGTEPRMGLTGWVSAETAVRFKGGTELHERVAITAYAYVLSEGRGGTHDEG